MSTNETPELAVPVAQRVSLRVWPALIVLAIQFTASHFFEVYGSSHIHSMLGNAGAHILSTLVLTIGWMRAGNIPRGDRRIGLALLVAAIVIVVLSQLPSGKGRFLVIMGLPVLTVGMTAIFLATSWVPWKQRRLVPACFLAIWTILLCAMHVQFITSDFVVQADWRWKQQSLHAESDAGRAELHGTAKLPVAVGPLDWPGFRGPARDAIARGVRFNADWNTPPKLLWRRPVGPGHSSMAIVGDYLFTQEQADTFELVTCYDANTGEPVWSNSLNARHDDTLGGIGPRATPSYANDKLYAQSAGGVLQCLDAANGHLIWKLRLSTPESPDPPMYGYSSSPLVVGDTVIQFCSGAGRSCLLGLDAATGAERWAAANGTDGYGSPQLSAVAGLPQILLFDSAGLQSFDVAKGAMLWQYEWPRLVFARCLQPAVMDDGNIALGANADFGTRLVQVKNAGSAWDVQKVWNNGKHRPYFNDNVAHKGYLYGFDGNRLGCLDLKTGEGKWQGTRYGGQVMVVDDMDLLLVLTEKGKVVLVKADPSEFTEVASLDAINGKTWNHPAIANGKLYVRNSDEMACFVLPGNAATGH